MTTIAHIRVTAPGLKGFQGTADLAPFTLIVGPNKAGKTSLLDAVRAASMGVSGRPSGYATKSSDVSPPRVFVSDPPEGTIITVDLSTGASFERLITNGRNETARADKLADELIGRPLIDVSTLMSSTAGQARAAMAACLHRGGLVAGWTVDEAAAAIEAHMLARVDETDDTITRSAWLEPLVTLRSRLPRCPITGAEDDGGGWMAAMLPLAEADLTLRTQAKTGTASAWKAAEKSPPQAPPEDLGKAKADRQRASASLAEGRSLAEQGRRYVAALAAWTAERDRLQGEVDRITAEGKQRRAALDALREAPLPGVESHLREALAAADLAPMPEPGTIGAVYTEAVDAARVALDAPIPGPDAAEIARLEVELTAADAELSRLTQEQASRVVDEARAMEAMRAACAVVVQARTDRDNAMTALMLCRTDLAASGGLHAADSACKTCGDVDPYNMHGRAEELRRKVAEHESDVAANNDSLMAAERAHQDASGAHQRAIEALAHVYGQREQAVSLCASIRADIARLTDPAAVERIRATQRAALATAELARDRELTRLAQEHRRELADRSRRIDEAQAAIGAREREIAARRQTEIADAEAALARLRASLASVQAARNSLGEPPQEPSTAPVDVAALEAEIARCEGIEAARTRYEKARTDHAAIESGAMTAGVRWAAGACLLQSIRLAVADLAATAVEPIQRTMDAVIADLPEGIGSRPYYLAPDDFGIRLSDGRRIPLQNASGAERLVGEAVIGVALAALQGCPVAVAYIDEIARVQDDHLAGLVRALARAVERGAVSQVIATMPLADDPDLAEARLALVRDVPGVTVLDVRDVLGTRPVVAAMPITTAVADDYADAPF